MDPQKEALKRAWREKERQRLASSIPLPHGELRALFEFLDRPDSPPCDHSLRETIRFLESRNIETQQVIRWLREHGGHCDCEVLANVESEFGDILRTEI